MHSLIFHQKISPENILDFFTRIGGFLAIVGVFATFLQMYNSNSLGVAGVDLRELDHFIDKVHDAQSDQKEIARRIEEKHMNLERKYQTDAIRQLKKPTYTRKSAAHAVIHEGQVLYNDMWLPAEIYDDTHVIVAKVKGNLDFPEAKGLILEDLDHDSIRLESVEQFRGTMRPTYSMVEALKRSPENQVNATVQNMKPKYEQMNGRAVLVVGHKKLKGKRWFIANVDENEQFFLEKNLQIEDWVPCELELWPEGTFRAREIETGTMHTEVRPRDVRITNPMTGSLDIHSAGGAPL